MSLISITLVAPAAQKTFDIEEATVNALAYISMGVTVLVNFPSIYALDIYGTRKGVRFFHN